MNIIERYRQVAGAQTQAWKTSWLPNTAGEGSACDDDMTGLRLYRHHGNEFSWQQGPARRPAPSPAERRGQTATPLVSLLPACLLAVSHPGRPRHPRCRAGPDGTGPGAPQGDPRTGPAARQAQPAGHRRESMAVTPVSRRPFLLLPSGWSPNAATLGPLPGASAPDGRSPELGARRPARQARKACCRLRNALCARVRGRVI